MIPTHAQVNEYSNKTFVRYGKYFLIPKSLNMSLQPVNVMKEAL